MQILQAIPDNERTDAEWDELNELEIMFAPGNRVGGEPDRRGVQTPVVAPRKRAARGPGAPVARKAPARKPVKKAAKGGGGGGRSGGGNPFGAGNAGAGNAGGGNAGGGSAGSGGAGSGSAGSGSAGSGGGAGPQ